MARRRRPRRPAPRRPAEVTSIEVVEEEGVFMPHTLRGALVVDGVVAPEMAAAHVPGWAASLRLHRAVIAVFRRAPAPAARSRRLHGGHRSG